MELIARVETSRMCADRIKRREKNIEPFLPESTNCLMESIWIFFSFAGRSMRISDQKLPKEQNHFSFL